MRSRCLMRCRWRRSGGLDDLAPQRSENPIPQRRRYPPPRTLSRVVVDHMMPLDPPAVARAHAEVVNCIVRAVVEEVPGRKPDEQGIHENCAESCAKDAVKDQPKGDARAKRHDEAI